MLNLNNIDIEKDGIDHIRVDSNASTFLGRSLSPNYNRIFYHLKYGAFCSINSLLFYLKLKNRDDKIRELFGAQLKKYVVEQINSGKNEFIENNSFNKTYLDSELIKEIIWIRLLSNPELLELFVNNKLPYICYFVGNNNKVNITEGHIGIALNKIQKDIEFYRNNDSIKITELLFKHKKVI